MNSQQVTDLRLLYQAVYDENLREQADEYNNTVFDEDIVEVATEYFYTYGLNEDGIDILIEKVGLDNFVEFVYGLSEDLIVLTEARKSKAKRQEGTLLTRQRAKLEAQKKAKQAAQERTETERTEPESKGPDTEAKEEQPKSKKPQRGAIGEFIRKGMERHNTAMRLVGDTANTIGRIAGKSAPELTKGAMHGFGGTLGLLGRLSNNGIKEDFEYWVNSLVEEGYDLSEYTWDEMADIYLDEAKKSDAPRQTFLPKSRERDIGKHDDWKDKPSEQWGERPEAAKKLRRRAMAVVGTRRREDEETGVRESYDHFDYLLEYLVAEGYADTNENALKIMANMSEEWKQSIVES